MCLRSFLPSPKTGQFASNSTPVASNRFVLIHLRVTNTGSGDKTADVSESNFGMTGSRNVLYEAYGDKTSCGFANEGRIEAKLFPGGAAEGDVCFQTPRDESGLLLVAMPEVFSFNGTDKRYIRLQ